MIFLLHKSILDMHIYLIQQKYDWIHSNDVYKIGLTGDANRLFAEEPFIGCHILFLYYIDSRLDPSDLLKSITLKMHMCFMMVEHSKTSSYGVDYYSGNVNDMIKQIINVIQSKLNALSVFDDLKPVCFDGDDEEDIDNHITDISEMLPEDKHEGLSTEAFDILLDNIIDEPLSPIPPNHQQSFEQSSEFVHHRSQSPLSTRAPPSPARAAHFNPPSPEGKTIIDNLVKEFLSLTSN